MYNLDIVNVVFYFYYINGGLLVDLFINGIVPSDMNDYLSELANEFLNDTIFNKKSVGHFSYGQIKHERIKRTNKITRFRVVGNFKVGVNVSDQFIEIREQKDNRNMINFVKRMCLRVDTDYEETIIHFDETGVDSYDSVMSFDLIEDSPVKFKLYEDLIKENKEKTKKLEDKIEKDAGKVKDTNNTKNDCLINERKQRDEEQESISQMFDFRLSFKSKFLVSIEYPREMINVMNHIKTSPSIITPEMSRNIRYLKDINFIHDDGYYVYKDRVILKQPFCWAWGDWIKHRDRSYIGYYKSHEECISRINWYNIWTDFTF